MAALDGTPAGRPRGAARVLVVDGSAQARVLYASYLAANGRAVHTAVNRLRATAAIRESVPDVIVMDVDDPVVDGVEICLAMRADSTTQHVSIIGLTSDAATHGVVAFRAGCDVVLSKPCSRTLLLASVRLLLDRPRAIAQESPATRAARA